MGKRKARIIATVYGDEDEKERLNKLKELTGKSTSDLLKHLVENKYQELSGSK